MRVLNPVWWVVLATACPQPSQVAFDNGSLVLSPPVAVEAVADPGLAPVSVLVRHVSEQGMSSAEGSVELDVGGEMVSVELDAFGYGDVLVSESMQVEGVAVAVLGALTPPLDLPRARWADAAASTVASASAGFFVAADRELWWSGPGLVDHRIADLRAPINGVRTRDIDQDETLDAVVWAGDTVVLLQGRPGGGARFAAGVEAPGWTALGADAGDLDEDGDEDLLILWETGTEQVLQVWKNDGDFGLRPLDDVVLAGQALDVGAALDRPDSPPAITVLLQGEAWKRFRIGPDGGLQASGGTVTLEPEAGSTLHTPGDITGDGVGDLVVAPPRVSGAPRELQIWELSDDRPTVLRVDVEGGWFGAGDTQGDGLTDLWLLSESPALLQTMVPTDGQFVVRDHGLFPAVGPIAVSDLDGDVLPDVLVAAPDVWLSFRGRLSGEEEYWAPSRGAVRRQDARLVGPIGLVDVESGVDEIAGPTRVSSVTEVKMWALRESGPVEAFSVDLEVGDREIVDFTSCESSAWVLLADEVIHVDLGGSGVVGRQPVSGGAAVSCGVADGGVVAAVAHGSDVMLLGVGASNLGNVVGPARDAAFVDGAVVPCAAACAAWPGLGDTDGVVMSEGAMVEVR
ncbi:MAG: hypothetical protein AB8H79_09505, partial [Myxococcota bacterium]